MNGLHVLKKTKKNWNRHVRRSQNQYAFAKPRPWLLLKSYLGYSKRRILQMMEHFSEVLKKQVKITIITRSADEFKKTQELHWKIF
jgi:hypothetical protein